MAHNNKFKKALRVVLNILNIIINIILGIAMIPVMIVVTLALPGVAAWYCDLEMADWLSIFELISQLPANLMAQLLPFPWKKHFMRRQDLEYYTEKSQADYYFRCAPTAKTIERMDKFGIRALWKRELGPEDLDNLLGNDVSKRQFQKLSNEDKATVYLRTQDTRLLELMTNEAINIIWDTTQNPDDDWKAIIRCGWRLERYQFTAILKNKPQLVREYVRKNTPADWMVLAMAKEGTYAQELQRCAERYGLSPKVIEALAPETLEELKQPLRCFKQRTFLQRCKTAEGVQHFFELVGDIEVNAQMAMADWQYHLFHQAGHKLCHEFVHDVIRRQDVTWFRLILELEGQDLQLTDQEVAIINSSPELTDTLFLFVVKKKKEETESDGIVL